MIWHRLSLALGATVGELQRRMSSEEFTDWIAYSRIEPFGWEMESWRAGMIASAICNAIHATVPRARGTARPKPLTPRDFFPNIGLSGDTSLSPKQLAYLKRKHGKRRHAHGGLRRRDGQVPR